MKYVIGVDLGTSAVKLLLVNQDGEVKAEVSKAYPLIQEKTGYSEQNPELWIEQVIAGLSDLLKVFEGNPEDIEGISFSGQMHGLVLLDENHNVLRNAILWNDTRTTKECEEIYQCVGERRLLDITKNPALEGFTLPKILWVKNNEPEIFNKVKLFLLPKDYVRYKLTGKIHSEYSDAAGTLLLNIEEKEWSREICELLDINPEICPPLVSSHEKVGKLTNEMVEATGLNPSTSVFAGGADNACGAIGAGILEEGKTLASIGTSGVILSFEEDREKDFQGRVHYFNHSAPEAFYTMGVTLAAGYSLSWFRDVFSNGIEFEELLEGINTVPVGSNGLIFTPYIVGERTPHMDATIRGSFIGIDSSHEIKHFSRAVLEGITFSLNETVEILRENGKSIDTIISIGGGTKNEIWLQMQADIFNANVIKLKSEQGPGMGAAMLAAYGCDWFDTLKDCRDVFVKEEKTYYPILDNVKKYNELFAIYKDVYINTSELNNRLMSYRI